MKTGITETGSEHFQQYLSKHKDKVKNKSHKVFYPVNVVAEASSQGFFDQKTYEFSL